MKGHEMRAQETGWAPKLTLVLCFSCRVSNIRDHDTLTHYFSLIHVGALLTWAG